MGSRRGAGSEPQTALSAGPYTDVPPSARRTLTIVPAPADRRDWPKPHPNTEVPKSATFVGVAHYAKTGPSLTSVGWNSSLASDGLRIPGGIQGTFEDFTPGNIEPLWQAAFPPGTLRGRIGYGLYGVSGSGYWAVIYRRHRQLEALMAHGADARAAKALSWPTLALGLSVAGLKQRWPALSLLDAPPTTRCVSTRRSTRPRLSSIDSWS